MTFNDTLSTNEQSLSSDGCPDSLLVAVVVSSVDAWRSSSSSSSSSSRRRRMRMTMMMRRRGTKIHTAEKNIWLHCFLTVVVI
jgi:hypothetical protein